MVELTCSRCKDAMPESRWKMCEGCRAAARLVKARLRSATGYVEKSYPYDPVRHRVNRLRFEEMHPERVRASEAAWRARNVAKVKEMQSKARDKYRRGNLEKFSEASRRRYALKMGAQIGNFTPEQLAQRLSMYCGCWICKSPEWDHVDHVKPLAKGGPHILANMRPACARCNMSKGSTWPFIPKETKGRPSCLTMKP